MRERYFKYSAEQRQIISDELADQNIRSLTLFSFYFDLFSSSHQTDIKNFKVIDLDQLDLNNDLVKSNEQSSFILYNCARINCIIEKFEKLHEQGVYKSQLPDIDLLDFKLLLRNEFEKKLCVDFLLKYDALMSQLNQSLEIKSQNQTIHSKVCLNRLLSFLVDLSNYFSKYYTKIHILEVKSKTF
jgi:arginyl-tRNA synthetase